MLDNSIKISIIVPAYKPFFLKECLDSIFAQTYTNFELIVVNDCSPFDLDSIIDFFSDNRLIYYKNSVGYGAERLVDNWNNSLNYASGKYVICMGDDDKLLPNCLENYIKLIMKFPELDVFHAQTQIINEKSELISLQESRPILESVYSAIWHLWQGQRQFIGDWLFRVETLKNIGGYTFTPYAWAADHLTVFSLAQNKGIANMQTFGFQYRENSNSITKDSTCTKKKIEAMLYAKDWYKKFLSKHSNNKNDELYRKVLIMNLESHISRRIASDLSKLLASNPFRIIHLIRKRKKYKLASNTLCRAFAYSLYEIINR